MIRLAVRVSRDQAEVVLAELLELAPAGVEEVQGEQETVEYAVYGAPGELPALPDLKALAGESLVEISTSEIPDDWHERWRDFHRPVLVQAPHAGHGTQHTVPAVRIRPPWEGPRGVAESSVIEIVIDPGQAFGTGGHATTRLCLELLLELAVGEPPRGPLLDLGTGSGVLAIAASALGFDPVLALDNERESVQAARENALVNDTSIEVRRFDLRVDPLPSLDAENQSGPSSMVMIANLLRPLLLELSSSMSHAPAHLLASGLLCAEVDEVAAAFVERLGMRERERRTSGEWSAVWLSA